MSKRNPALAKARRRREAHHDATSQVRGAANQMHQVKDMDIVQDDAGNVQVNCEPAEIEIKVDPILLKE